MKKARFRSTKRKGSHLARNLSGSLSVGMGRRDRVEISPLSNYRPRSANRIRERLFLRLRRSFGENCTQHASPPPSFAAIVLYEMKCHKMLQASVVMQRLSYLTENVFTLRSLGISYIGRSIIQRRSKKTIKTATLRLRAAKMRRDPPRR